MKGMLIRVVLVTFCLAPLAGCANKDNPAPATLQPPAANEAVGNANAEARHAADNAEEAAQRDLGAMTPEEALEYMTETENLVIVDVAATRGFERIHFEGAINIPIEELDRAGEDALYMEIPGGRPVLLHCRQGVIVPGAYERVKELRPDIPEISYIDGSPLFDEYNAAVSGRQN